MCSIYKLKNNSNPDNLVLILDIPYSIVLTVIGCIRLVWVVRARINHHIIFQYGQVRIVRYCVVFHILHSFIGRAFEYPTLTVRPSLLAIFCFCLEFCTALIPKTPHNPGPTYYKLSSSLGSLACAINMHLR